MRGAPRLAGMVIALGCACEGGPKPTLDASTPPPVTPGSAPGPGSRPARAPDSTPNSGPARAPDSRPEAQRSPEGPPLREANRAEVKQTIEVLTGHVRAGATDPQNAWAMAHGLIGFSLDLKTSDGRNVIDVLVTDFVQEEEVAGRTIFGFPPRSARGLPVEPHPNLIVKTLLEAGVPLDRRFELKGKKRITLQRLADDAAWAFVAPKNEREWQKYAWSGELFAAYPGIDRQIRTQAGTLDVGRLAREGLARLEQEQAFLRPLHRAGRPDQLKKRRQGIYAHSCGGLHFVAAGVHGAAALGDPRLVARAREQLDLLLFRWDAERRIYRQMIHSQPKYRWPLLIQELKFHGHVLETLAGVINKTRLLPKSDEALRRIARQITADLIDAIAELDPLYRAQAQLRTTAPQSYYDLIGDGCHALHGLKQGLVAFFDR